MGKRLAMQRAYDVAIIGGGPAGLNAALVLGRARRTVRLVDDGHQRNRPARESHGLLGQDGCPPRELLERARSQLGRYPTIEFSEDQVGEIDGQIDGFQLSLQRGGPISARRILFATGMYDELPEIDGLREHWGKRVFVCPYCDGWEFRDEPMVVIGNTRSALELAQELRNWSRDLVVCPTTQTPVTAALRAWQTVANVRITEAPPVRMREHNGTVAVECANGEIVDCAGLFVCCPLKQHSDLPEKVGCELTDQSTIRVDADSRTTVLGVFAAGDCITRHHQIVFAAASAARAAIAINSELYQADAQALVESEVTNGCSSRSL